MVKKIRIENNRLPESLVQALANRDAALWVSQSSSRTLETINILGQLISLPWKLVLCESGESEFVKSIEAQNEGVFTSKRGFLHLVAMDPEALQLPPRALPVFFLNGRQDAPQPEESSNLGVFGSMRRRLNMLNELVTVRPKIVVLLCDGNDQPLQDFFTIWEQEKFRSLVIILTTAKRDVERIDEWLNKPNSAVAVEHCNAPVKTAVLDLVQRLNIEIPESHLIIRVRNEVGSTDELNVTDCDLIERPLLDGYELIQVKDLRQLLPDELTREEFESFFSRSISSWKPYAAGLPWLREKEARKKVMDALKAVAELGPSENRVLQIISESGAGGTTFARTLAFEAAMEGYPTLVARQSLTEFVPIELSGFLYRVHLKSISRGIKISDSKGNGMLGQRQFEVPWLVVFDANHWEGRQGELRGFLTALNREGRPVVLLTVNSPFIPLDLTSTLRASRIASLSHELTMPEALRLGDHLNKYLRKFGEERSSNEWREFWEAHRPDNITTTIAHFWIALEFWLKRQFDLSQSIQSWLYDSFKTAKISDDLRLLLLEIAALSIERQPLPEGLMPLSPKQNLPYSVLLEEVRLTVPALALVREVTPQVHKIWAMAHDLLGRYMITSTFYDHGMLERLGLTDAKDPIQLRLLLLRRIASRSSLALKPFRALALNFAIKILKIDSSGNQEFIHYWRDIIDILMAMPASLRETSRVFNHHIAVSLRRIAKYKELDIKLEERKGLLDRAIKHLEYSLNDLEPENSEEPDLNLYTSLALAYQDLADIEREMGALPDRIQFLRSKATEATRQALQEDPTDSYVLETIAKNLIQNGELYPEQAAASGTEALGYIYQAITLERSEIRQSELTRLANRSLQLLKSETGRKQAKLLAQKGNPLGSLAEAWLLLTEGIPDLNKYDIAHMPPENVKNALIVLEESNQKSNWMLLRFRYDLISSNRPFDFTTQLRLLDELEGTGYRMPLQIELEYAILLHQLHRNAEASRKFQNLRRNLNQVESVVEVPSRLFWLRANERGVRRICEAQVIESRGQRSVASVPELKEKYVPFIPQDFGVQEMRAGAKFKCAVSFGRNGPFLKPPQIGVQI